MFQVMLLDVDVLLIASITICLTFSAFPPFAVIVTLVILVQLRNAFSPMLSTLSGIVKLVMLQPANAHSPMLVTLFGIVRLVIPLQPANA